MRADELRERLGKMSATEKDSFKRKVGVPGYDDDMILDHFVKMDAWERKICDVLGVPTEADKISQATLQQAADQRRSVNVAWTALIIAVVSLLLQLVDKAIILFR